MGTDSAPPIDLMSGEFFARDPFGAFSWMRAHAPVFYDEANDLWALSRYEDVRSAATDPIIFSSAGGIRPHFPPLPMMIDMDDPEHARRRRLVSSGFTPRRIRAMEDHVRKVCDRVLDGVCERGEAEFVSEIAARLPLELIGDMLGVAPEDRDDLLRWSDQMLHSQSSTDPAAMLGAAQAFAQFAEYMEPVFEERRTSGNDEDLVGVLVHAEVDGERLDAPSLLHETLLILIGGDETTRHVLSGGMLALLEHPEQLATLRRDRSLLATAVEEMLRWVSPLQNTVRTTMREVDIHGEHVPVGAEVMLLYPSANRDEGVFEDPERFDIERAPNPHLAFGFGPHFCLGNQLARLELRVMFDRLLERLPGPKLATTGPLRRRPSNFVRGLDALPVLFQPSRRLTATG